MQSNFENRFKFKEGYYVNSNIKCKLIEGLTPLKHFTFFLDIENRSNFQKVQEKIKQLGGKIENFFTAEVTNLITDKNYPEQSSNLFIDKNKLCYNVTKNKTRADEMIRRVQFGKSDPTISKKKTVNCKKTFIWNTEYALNIFKKLSKHTKQHSSPKQSVLNSSKILKGFYIKIESKRQYYRPCFKILDNNKWPTINLGVEEELNHPNISPAIKSTNKVIGISSESNSISNKGSLVISTEPKCGFCEICKVEYDVLISHLSSNNHKSFSNNNENFTLLDSLIKKSVDIETFLNKNRSTKIDESMNNFQCSTKCICNMSAKLNSFENLNCIENNFVRQTRQSLVRIKEHVLKHKFMSNNSINDYMELKNEKGNCISNISNLKLIEKTIDEDTKNITTNKNAMSLFYRVVESEIQKCNTEEKCPLQCVDKNQTLIVKFKKMRKSELSVLNGEAENFMFPKKTIKSISKNEKTTLKRKFHYYPEGELQQAVNTFESQQRESISKLNSMINNIRSSENKNFIDSTNFKISNNLFSFEKIPMNETWFNVFRRQDDCKERTFEHFGSTVFRRLPYEMGPLPPLQSKTSCFSCTLQNNKNIILDLRASVDKSSFNFQNEKKRTKKGDNLKNNSHSCKNSTFKNFEMPRKSPREHASTLAVLSCFIQKSHEHVNTKTLTYENKEFYSNSQLSLLIESVKNLEKKKHPQLRKQKKLLCLNNKKKMVKVNTFQKLEKKHINSQQLTNELDYFLVSSYNDKFEQISSNQTTEFFANGINLFDINNFEPDQDLMSDTFELHKNDSSSLFSHTKKRKNNKTGWPNKKKFSSRQQKINEKHYEIKKDTKNSGESFLNQMSPITPPDTDADEKVQSSSINQLENKHLNCSYIKGKNDTETLYTCKSESLKDNSSESLIRYENMNTNVNKKSDIEKNLTAISNSSSLSNSSKQRSLHQNVKLSYSPRKLRKPRGRWYRER